MKRTKICTKCYKEKPLEEFGKCKTILDGHRPDCKECHNKSGKEYYLNNKLKVNNRHTNYYQKIKYYLKDKYNKNKELILQKKKQIYKENKSFFILKEIKQRCENKNNKSYKYYGLRGIKCLITEDDINFLYKRDKAHLMKKPSIDRIDNDGNYCLENCRIIELSENTSKSGFERKRKTILQFNLKGEFIKEWDKQILAARVLKINKSCISACLKLRQVSAGGFIWKYKENN